MPELVFRPDTEYGLECIPEMFEIPLEIVPNEFDTKERRVMKVLFIEAVAKKTGQYAIEKYEKLRHWKFRDDIPVQIDESVLDFDFEDFEFSSPLSKDPIAKDMGWKKKSKSYVIKLWFETQKIRTVQFEPKDQEYTAGAVSDEYLTQESGWEEADGRLILGND